LAATVISFSTVQTAEAKQWDMCSWDEIPQSVLNRIIRRPDYEDILRRMFVHCPDAANALTNPLVVSFSGRTLEYEIKQNEFERASLDSTSSTGDSDGDTSASRDSGDSSGGAGGGSSSGDTNGSDGGGSSSGDSNTSGDSSSSTGSDGGRGSNANNGGGNGSEGDSPGKGKGANNDE
jgi:hypothetical protein